jgi:formylglycine-generating enzyme required for sulfatase activity
VNCLNWYDAEAFCIWDGGRLPTDAELNYAASGGSEQRLYPWGSAAPDCTYANYMGGTGGSGYCVSPSGAPNPVGSESPKGDGKYGQTDLAGNLAEWVQDSMGASTTSYLNPCTNCAVLSSSGPKLQRSGFFSIPAGGLTSASHGYTEPGTRAYISGARCARAP